MVLSVVFLLFVGVPLGLLIVSVGRTVASGPTVSDGATPSAGRSVSGRPVTHVAAEPDPVTAPAPPRAPVPADLLAAATPVNAGSSRFVSPAAAAADSSGDLIAFRGRPVTPLREPRSHTG